MSRHAWIVIALLLALLGSLANVADAVPRRRRANYTYYPTYSSGYVSVAPKRDTASSDYPQLSVYFDYDQVQSREPAAADRIEFFLELRDEAVAKGVQLVAEVKLTDLRDATVEHVRYVPVTITASADSEYPMGLVELSNDHEEEPLIEASRIYRLFVNLHRQSPEYGADTVLGQVPGPYYAATSGDSPISQARQEIAMRTFREWYYTERGWARNANYPMDCHAYYRWATGNYTVGSTDGWANLDHLFSGETPYLGGGDIAAVSSEEPIHGDYVRKPGHTFMLLAYDPQEGQVWTMEANFNGTIEICIRSVASGWTVGHLEPEHIRPELFDLQSDDGMDDAMAQGPAPASEDRSELQ